MRSPEKRIGRVVAWRVADRSLAGSGRSDDPGEQRHEIHAMKAQMAVGVKLPFKISGFERMVQVCGRLDLESVLHLGCPALETQEVKLSIGLG